MILKQIIIQNYRKFVNSSLSLTDDITLLAGANNSGKTSIIDLLGNIFNTGKSTYCVTDIPVTLSKNWSERAYPIFGKHFDEGLEKEKTIASLVNELYPLEPTNTNPAILIPSAVIKFRIDYELNDDIRNFADYIMDFDPVKRSIYFEYSFEVTRTSLSQAIESDFDKLKSRYEKVDDRDADTSKVKLFKEKIISTYAAGIVEKCYFTDSTFRIRNELEISDFRKLFNYKNIIAGRPLDDQNNGQSKSISKNVLDLACHNDDWQSLLDILPDKILQPIEELDITEVVRKASVDGLSDAMRTIAQANGGNTGGLVLNLDITEDAINSLIGQVMNAKYQLEDHFLGEASQGLGYSNMIFILLQLETYKRNIDPLLVNLFVIEEPESHMHPQMQNVFGKYLRTYYKEKKIQGLVTTHSSEMVRATDMRNLRVARPSKLFESEILDFSSFKESLSSDSVLDNFYDWFYEIGFSDIVFADRVILYEGDTERMLIRKLSLLEDFQVLNQQYIAFVQVGGAYAYNYSKLIEFMNIKTLILTDIDYQKSANNVDLIMNSKTTNATINNFYKLKFPNASPTVADLYQWKEKHGNILFNGSAFLAFQGKSDKFARTLEEAMLAQHYNINAIVEKERAEWKELRDSDNLKYTIPQEAGKYTLREIVKHTSNGKTDFMYSVILNNLTEKMLPHYIKEGLTWLVQ